MSHELYNLEENIHLSFESQLSLSRVNKSENFDAKNRETIIFIISGECSLSFLELDLTLLALNMIIISPCEKINLQGQFDSKVYQFPVDSREYPYTHSLIDLHSQNNRNQWILVYGSASFYSKGISLAFVNLKDYSQFKEILLPKEHYHKHVIGYEYYLCLKGGYTLEVENEKIHLNPFQLLEVQPQQCHKWINSIFPVMGLNFRFRSIDGDKTICE